MASQTVVPAPKMCHYLSDAQLVLVVGSPKFPFLPPDLVLRVRSVLFVLQQS